mmetsp:Transcript_12529/g.34626  ORF Transcript_12529/g.34626 Transcript_12529/m.34626 type:complete len:221 (-) Transcript_12529:1716-2378(-)
MLCSLAHTSSGKAYTVDPIAQGSEPLEVIGRRVLRNVRFDSVGKYNLSNDVQQLLDSLWCLFRLLIRFEQTRAKGEVFHHPARPLWPRRCQLHSGRSAIHRSGSPRFESRPLFSTELHQVILWHIDQNTLLHPQQRQKEALQTTQFRLPPLAVCECPLALHDLSLHSLHCSSKFLPGLFHDSVCRFRRGCSDAIHVVLTRARKPLRTVCRLPSETHEHHV